MTILVVGSLHLDVVLTAPHLPALDETVTGSSVDYVFGGKGGNQAVAAARLGATVAFAGRAGGDGFGDMLRARLAEVDIDTSQLQRDAGPSGMSAAIVDAQGDYGAVIVSAANKNIDADQISVPPDTSLVLLQNEIPEEVNLSLVRKANKIGAKVWLNAAPARKISDALLELADLVVVNRVEADFYADTFEGLNTMITLGADGVQFEGRNHPAHSVNAISTHGAGDMFVGALAAGQMRGDSMEDAIGFAQSVAAWHVSTDPATRGHAASLARFLKTQANR